MTFQDKLRAGKFLVTSEIGPPKGIETKNILEAAELIRGRVDAINVTDLQSSVLRLGSLAVSCLLRQKGFEPIYQLTCRDRNRLALQSDLLSAASLGIENVLILTGDYPT
jgi:5,10-methylenetetrahydrofolate reductase